MGYYVNPKNEDKESWLRKNAKELTSPPTWEEVTQECYPVCLISNVVFTAAGIAFSKEELNQFQDPTDKRFKKWFV